MRIGIDLTADANPPTADSYLLPLRSLILAANQILIKRHSLSRRSVKRDRVLVQHQYVKDGKIYIDGKEQTQAVSFCPEEMAGSFGPYEVPEDSYFVMGDNRNNSLDSRYWDNTYVKKEAILAKAGFRYWPLNKVGFVNKSAEK